MKKSKVQTNLKRKVKEGKASIREVMATSAVGTQVHEIQDPSERMIAILGASMFNEPKYYSTDPEAMNRGYNYDESDFDEHAQLIINTAHEIAESESPRDLLAIAHWARKEMKLRTTPQVLVAVAAQCADTKQYVRSYCPKVIQRADELKQVFVASRSLYGSQTALPNSLKRGLADAFAKFKERDFLKYEGQHRPYFSDVLKMIDRSTNYPLPKPLDHYLKTGEVTDAKATPVIAARKNLSKMKEFGPRAQQFAKKSGAGWEVLLSQFGNTKDVWEHLIESNQLPYMAMLRNLRNILQAGVSAKHIQMVADKIFNGAVKSKQLPHRFLAARDAITGQLANNHWYQPQAPILKGAEKKLYDALGEAVERVIEAMDNIPGVSLIAVDNSGSMSSPISANSQMSMNKAACILGTIIAKKSEPGSVIGAFGDTWKPAQINPQGGGNVFDIADEVAALPVGHSTNAEAALKWALKQKSMTFDRIILISDTITYGSSNYYWGRRSRDGRTVKDLIKEYRQKKNKKCYLHCLDLAGHGRSLTEQKDTKSNLVAGYSEKLLDTILEFEGLRTEVVVNEETGETEEKQVFTIEYIRDNF